MEILIATSWLVYKQKNTENHLNLAQYNYKVKMYNLKCKYCVYLWAT